MSHLDHLLPATTASESETRSIGRSLAETLVAGDVVALFGNLGAGKTALTKGLGEGLGIDAEHVKSPTFTLLHEYTSGRLPLYHFDAYRTEQIDEFLDLGYEEYFFGNGVCVIEWADKIEALLPQESLRIRLDHGERDIRRIDFVRPGDNRVCPSR
jgi:tRNA threonylcarbamoyladenosine biosynthesis protein TsaE